MILSLAIEAAKEAGVFIKDNIGNITTIERKSTEINLVTDIDKKSESMIISAIKEQFPAHDIIAEESGRNIGNSDYRWIIDPLDGTTNYAHGLPLFCVSIGVEFKGDMVAGVIYDPMRDEIFTAEKGAGAALNGKPIRVSTEDRLIRSLLITGFPYNVKDNPHNAIRHFNNLIIEAQGIRRLGSAALDLAYVACGRAEGFWEVNLHPWDISAGILIITEAGGTVTDFEREPVNAYTPNIVASNGRIHSEILRVLSKI
jgi:myo-inositol-1(or 4)-monophosphatase